MKQKELKVNYLIKKNKLLILLIITIISLIPTQTKAEEYNITFNATGGIYKNEQNTYIIEKLEKEKIEYPKREGYKFIGYYEENGVSLEKYLEEENIINSDITFYAKWKSLEDIKKETIKKIVVIILGTVSIVGYFIIVLFCKEED